ncbi:MAG TPA: hypothetical protein VEB86_03550 [Chryseosolibacter sp.]|nr:hypothetical protein [Chryseosolibacter sp.]
MKPLLFGIVFLIIARGATASEHPADGDVPAFEKGHIVRKDGSVIRGEFQARANHVYSEMVFFRGDGEKNFTTYYAADLSGFFIEPDTHFESHLVSEGWRFLKFLIKGEASLLEQAALGNVKYYLRMQDDTLRLLEYHERIIFQGERKFLQKQAPYKQLLKEKFAACPALEKQISRLSGYDRRDLVEVVQDYNFCLGGGRDAFVQKGITTIFLGSAYSKSSSDPHFDIFNGMLEVSKSTNRIFTVTIGFHKGAADRSRTVFYGTRYNLHEVSRLTSLTLQGNGNIAVGQYVHAYVFAGSGYTHISYRQEERTSGYVLEFRDEDVTWLLGVGFRFFLSQNVFIRPEFSYHIIPGFADGRVLVNSSGQRYDVIGPDFANIPQLSIGLNFKVK